MRPKQRVPAPTTLARDLQLTIPLSYPTPPARLTQRWWPTALLRTLCQWLSSCLRPAPYERRWISPELRGWEAPTDLLARRHTYLYIRSLSGEGPCGLRAPSERVVTFLK
jgi:hypothetical protein